MNTAIYNEMTKTYQVKKADGSFDSYTVAQYEEKFGALPEAVEDVTDVVEEEEVVPEVVPEVAPEATTNQS